MRVKTMVISSVIAAAAWGTPALANAALSDCKADRMCMWGNNDYKWMIGDRAHGGGVANVTGSGNDEMDSWANRSASYAGCMYANANGGGDKQTMGRNDDDNNVNPFNSDEVSSWKTNGSC